MIGLLVVIIFCVICAHLVQQRTYFYLSARDGIKRDLISKILYIGIVGAFIWFAGLRSSYNDTSAYMWNFELIDTNNINLNILRQAYGGFDLYQEVIKKYISTNPQVFIFVTAMVTNVLYLRFYTRNTKKFTEMILLYAIGNYIFCMAGLKQAIAIGIGLYAIDCYMKGRYIKAIIILLIAMMFHPYIICLICIPFLRDRIWDKKSILVIVLCILAFMNMDKVFEVFEVIGKDYSGENFNDYTINPIRVLIEFVPVGISFVYRHKLNENASGMLTLGINMRNISFIFIAMGLVANPIYFGRMSTYFTVLSAITVPEMLDICWGNKKIYIWGYYVFFFLYFIMDMTKIGSISIFYDQFNRVAFSSLFL